MKTITFKFVALAYGVIIISSLVPFIASLIQGALTFYYPF